MPFSTTLHNDMLCINAVSICQRSLYILISGLQINDYLKFSLPSLFLFLKQTSNTTIMNVIIECKNLVSFNFKSLKSHVALNRFPFFDRNLSYPEYV